MGDEEEMSEEEMSEEEIIVSKEGYEKDKNEVILKLSVGLQQMMIGYPDIALACVEKTRRIILKYEEITEEQRKEIQGKDDEEVKKIRAIQDGIKNCGLPKYKVVEDWDAKEIAEIKQEQLNVQTEKIVKDAITKVILAGIELFIVGDLSDMDAINEIEGCLQRIKNE